MIFFYQEFDQTGNNKFHPLNDDDKSNKSDIVEKGLVVAKIPKEGSDISLDSGEEKKDISKEDTENIGKIIVILLQVIYEHKICRLRCATYQNKNITEYLLILLIYIP